MDWNERMTGGGGECQTWRCARGIDEHGLRTRDEDAMLIWVIWSDKIGCY